MILIAHVPTPSHKEFNWKKCGIIFLFKHYNYYLKFKFDFTHTNVCFFKLLEYVFQVR